VAGSEEIEETLRAVAAGGSFFPSAITLKLVEAVAHPELSKRERQVLEYLANGRSNKEIGAILYVSELTVKGHVRSILEKLDAKGRSEAIAIALKRGLIRANGPWALDATESSGTGKFHNLAANAHSKRHPSFLSVRLRP
jgi:DNA-binding NarL/FixJ family response regulator